LVTAVTHALNQAVDHNGEMAIAVENSIGVLSA
jgi:hypothetical protein